MRFFRLAGQRSVFSVFNAILCGVLTIGSGRKEAKVRVPASDPAAINIISSYHE
jgi:hypothetical protein